ncbi:MAG TPA: alpha/beta hydrolase [Ottowia sp.]|uniref:alpha/beta hydrolase n=1 Tax=Ottowia sp. TaxID=1898956 RepID=UPI002C5D2D0A|nr:alpha/beta hydrolase [Ottowia sp.]HMN21536.1 alpha/beta hydrolase [Ottowia sp.]
MAQTASSSTPPPTQLRADEPGLPECRRADQVDLEAGALLRILSIPARGTLSMPEIRRQRRVWDLIARAGGRADPVAEVEDFYIPTESGRAEARVYRPTARRAEPLPAFVWFHGGAFMIGGLTTADTICRHLARSSGAAVVSVRYRLAPENNLYAGRADCMAALRWLTRHGDRLGIDASRLAVGGDSAGGNLAAAVAQRCTQEEAIALRLQVLVYPATNLRDEFASKQENAEGYLLTAQVVDSVRDLLQELNTDVTDPWVSPALNPRLAGLPPALVLTAGFDPIRDDGLSYAQGLRRAGVPVQLLHYPGQFHGFVNFDGLLRMARDALDRIGEALRLALAPEPQDAPANRTLEISAASGAPGPHSQPTLTPASFSPRLGAKWVSGSLMLGERLESARAQWLRDALRRAPWLSMVAGAWAMAPEAMPWLNPVTSWRAQLAQRHAPICIRESFHRS